MRIASLCSALLLTAVAQAHAQRALTTTRSWQPIAAGVTSWSGAIERSSSTKAMANQQAQMIVRPALVDLNVVRVDPARAKVRVIDVYKNSVAASKTRQAGFDLASVVRVTSTAVAVLNGGATTSYSIPNHAGLLKTQGRVSKPLASSTSLTGVFCVRNALGTSWSIVKAQAELVTACHEAIQAGPLLVEAGRLVVYSSELQRPSHRRSAVCVDQQQQLYLIATSEINLYDLAKWLVTAPTSASAGLGCVWALNLDGGTSSGLWIRGRPRSIGETTSTIPSALVVRN